MDESTTPLRIASRRILIGGGSEPYRIVPGVLSMQGAWITGFEPLDENTVLDSETLDLGDKWVTPSFVNAHTHIALGVMRGMDVETASAGNMVEEVFFRFESKCTKEDVLAFARVGAYACLMNGVGHIWDHYYHGDVVAQAMREVGLTGVVAPTLQDLSGPGKEMWVDSLGATQAIHSDYGYASRGIFAALGPQATDTVSAALWTRALKWSEQWDIPIHAHLAQSLEEVQRCRERHGLTPVEWLRSLGILDGAPGAVFAHALFATEQDLSLLDAHRHHLVFCPYSN